MRKEAAAQADVWSFGVSLYSAVCGVTPYQNIDEVFEPRFRRKFDEKRGDLPDDLIEVLKHTVVPEHEKRVSFEALRSFAFFR
jgi:serine/threonine protein kinase